MGDRFFNAEHTHQKLNNTICLFKGHPYLVRTDGGDEVSLSPLDGKKGFAVKYTDPDFDYTHIPLGYITVHGVAYYLAREPQRIVAQGLSPRSVRVFPGDDRVATSDLIIRKEFIDCVLGKHVDFNTAIGKLRNTDVKSISISRFLAIERQSPKIYMAHYRGRPVAISQNRGASFAPVEHKGAHLIIKRLRNHGVPLA